MSKLPELQLFTNIIFTFIQLSYILYFKPFQEKSVLISQIFGDFSVLILFCISGFYLNSIEDSTNYIVDTVFICITVTCVGFQTILMAYSCTIKVFEYLKGCRKVKVMDMTAASRKQPHNSLECGIDREEKYSLRICDK